MLTLDRVPGPDSRMLLFVFFAVTLSGAPIPAIGPGPYEVGSSNFEVSLEPTMQVNDYLKGKAEGQALYISNILVHPESALIAHVPIPPDSELYGSTAGKNLPVAMYVLYPTSKLNNRPGYIFPYTETSDNNFPHMQRAGEKPIFATSHQRFPLIVYSHGHEGHGLWDLSHLKYLASHGYIVVSVFHGDGRMDINSAVNMRPLLFKAALDFISARADFASGIDSDRIGASGGSLGGYTVLTAIGGKYGSAKVERSDARIKAAFGLVPFMGVSVKNPDSVFELWPFGKDFSGLKNVQKPFLAVYAENDVNVLPATVLAGLGRMSGTATGIALTGESHVVSNAALQDVYTWELLFFGAWLRQDHQAHALLYGAENVSVEGGVQDRKTFQHIKGGKTR